MLVEIENDNVHVILSLQNASEAKEFNIAVEDHGVPEIKRFFLEYPFMCEAFNSYLHLSCFSILIAKFSRWRKQKNYNKETVIAFLQCFLTAPHFRALLCNAPDRVMLLPDYCSRYNVFQVFEFETLGFLPVSKGAPYIEQLADYLISKRRMEAIDKEFFCETFAKVHSKHHEYNSVLSIDRYL